MTNDRPYVDRKTLTFGCRKLKNARSSNVGIQISASFVASGVSPGEARHYQAIIWMDAVSRAVKVEAFLVSRDGFVYMAMDGHRSHDGLRRLSEQVRDEFLKSPAWEILKDRQPDPYFNVSHTGEPKVKASKDLSTLM
jgi:hypothetical protein